MTTRSESVEQAGRVLAAGLAAQQSMTPRQQAESAWEPSCGLSVDDVEDLIRVQRGLPQIHRKATA